MSAAEQIQALTKTLEEANYHYYVLDDPQMEDYEYMPPESCWTGSM